MKKIAVVTTVALVVMSLAIPGARAGNHSKVFQPPEQAQSDHDFAVGNGNHLGFINMGFSAHSGSEGEDPKGYVSFHANDPDQEITGPVTCLNVVGNEAFIRFEVKKSNLPAFFPEGQEAFVRAVDNGVPQGGQPVDLVVVQPGFFTPPSPTNPCGFSPLIFPLDNGNITINDA